MFDFVCIGLVFLFIAGTFLLAGWMVVERVSEASKSNSNAKKNTGRFAVFFGLSVLLVLVFGVGGLMSGIVELMIVGAIALAVLIVGSMVIGFHNVATCTVNVAANSCLTTQCAGRQEVDRVLARPITVETANVHDTNSEASIIESQMLLVQKDDSLLSFS